VASQVGIAGCVVVEDEVTIWGQAGFTSAITIGEKAVVMAQAGVTKSLEGGKVYWGIPAVEARDQMKQWAHIKKIPEILEKMK
jgi:UDP-3-O-[3-hydroxymyristoyl] glucosamine N-acyltransferase